MELWILLAQSFSQKPQGLGRKWNSASVQTQEGAKILSDLEWRTYSAVDLYPIRGET